MALLAVTSAACRKVADGLTSTTHVAQCVNLPMLVAAAVSGHVVIHLSMLGAIASSSHVVIGAESILEEWWWCGLWGQGEVGVAAGQSAGVWDVVGDAHRKRGEILTDDAAGATVHLLWGAVITTGAAVVLMKHGSKVAVVVPAGTACVVTPMAMSSGHVAI